MPASAAILLSRQPLRPCAHTGWVRQASAAVEWLHNEDLQLLSSVGMQTWNLLTALAVMERVPVKLFVPVLNPAEFEGQCRHISQQFTLDPRITEFVPVPGGDGRTDRAMLMSRRDRTIVHNADLIIPVSIRSSGTMEELVQQVLSTGVTILETFATDGPEKSARIARPPIGNAVSAVAIEEAKNFVIHWTRGTSTAWPSELTIDLYRDILQAEKWPRSAICTLERILTMKRLIASARHMPENTPCVCFSDLAPDAVLPLMRWRARYAEMSFEPYGLGIRRDVAAKLGCRPVTYFDASTLLPPREERWCFQSVGKITDWRAEKEWRHRGDIDLGGLSPEAVRVFCSRPDEADRLRKRFSLPVTALFE